MKLTLDDLEIYAETRCLLHVPHQSIDLTGLTLISGANGTGKSLFLGTLHGIRKPSRGAIFWDGQTAQSTRAARGFMFQSSPILRRSVLANIEFALRSNACPRALVRKRAQHALTRVGLSARAQDPAGSLSGGERQRLSLARALAISPKVLLLDEPTTSLDQNAKHDFLNLLKEVVKTCPILLTSHDRDVFDLPFKQRFLISEERLKRV